MGDALAGGGNSGAKAATVPDSAPPDTVRPAIPSPNCDRAFVSPHLGALRPAAFRLSARLRNP